MVMHGKEEKDDTWMNVMSNGIMWWDSWHDIWYMDFPKSASHLELMTTLHMTQKEIIEIIEIIEISLLHQFKN